MPSTFKEKIIEDIDSVPEVMLPKLYKIIHLLTSEFVQKTNKTGTGMRGSLHGIWKDSKIDESLFLEAKKSLFPYEYK